MSQYNPFKQVTTNNRKDALFTNNTFLSIPLMRRSVKSLFRSGRRMKFRLMRWWRRLRQKRVVLHETA